MKRPSIGAGPWAFVLASSAACASVLNYHSPVGPRYAAPPPTPSVSAPAENAPAPVQLRVVTFNVKYARRVDRAIVALQSYAPLRDADVIMLQEMDAPATRRIADALSMGYVFYPSGVHPSTRRDFGNAILSRWPMTADEKLILPHLGRLRHGRRIATAVTIQVGDQSIRLYCLHLGTLWDIGWGKRRDQARVILEDAAAYARAIVAGDMNSHGIGKEFRKAGFLWPTEHNSVTTAFFNWDHIFLKGLGSPAKGAGVARDTLETSDHYPVWAVATLTLRGPTAP